LAPDPRQVLYFFIIQFLSAARRSQWAITRQPPPLWVFAAQPYLEIIMISSLTRRAVSSGCDCIFNVNFQFKFINFSKKPKKQVSFKTIAQCSNVLLVSLPLIVTRCDFIPCYMISQLNINTGF
jgi:hypothetical protein